MLEFFSWQAWLVAGLAGLAGFFFTMLPGHSPPDSQDSPQEDDDAETR